MDLLSGIGRYAVSTLCREMVDLDALASLAEAWLMDRGTRVLHFDLWVGQFLPSLALTSFLYTQDHQAQGPASASATLPESLHAPS